MPPKKVLKGDSRLGRKTRRNEIKDRSSLAEVPTPVGQRAQEAIPEEDIQDSMSQDLLPIRENLVTTAGASTSNNCRQESSEDSSDNSDLEGTRLNPTTVKKSVKVTLPVLASIPFTLNMPSFDTEMTYIVEVWLGALSANVEIRLMFVDNQILTYDGFKALDKESVYLLDRITTTGATTGLRIIMQSE